jgi:hypothetical protein
LIFSKPNYKITFIGGIKVDQPEFPMIKTTTVHLTEEIYRDFREIDNQRKENSEYQILINSLHEKSDLSPEEKTKLCSLYKTSIETSKKEEMYH